MVIEYKEPSSLYTLDDYKELDKEPTEYAHYRIAPKPFAEGGVVLPRLFTQIFLITE